jgi:fumarate reductase subunit D
MWRPKNINDLLRPVLILWAGIGFPIYIIDKNEQFINKHSKTLFCSAIIITINIICTLLLHTEITKDVHVFMIYFQIGSVYCQNIGLVYNLYMKKHDIAVIVL